MYIFVLLEMFVWLRIMSDDSVCICMAVFVFVLLGTMIGVCFHVVGYHVTCVVMVLGVVLDVALHFLGLLTAGHSG